MLLFSVNLECKSKTIQNKKDSNNFFFWGWGGIARLPIIAQSLADKGGERGKRGEKVRGQAGRHSLFPKSSSFFESGLC